ncbi:hypothetical protein AB0E62_16525 [Streptomyces sp. NPDC038707]|uniref:hypothetical protein n=1 Tax=Streptomyces sp. NPDC038707 TaxID=3154329 RepID=UPI0034115B71
MSALHRTAKDGLGRAYTAGFNLRSARTLRDVGLVSLDSAGHSFQVGRRCCHCGCG